MRIRRLRVTTLTVAALVTSGCDDRMIEPTRALVPGRPSRVISDGAHGGSTRLYFLPPLVPQPAFSGTFDASAFGRGSSDVVYVCVLSGTSCGSHVASFFGGTSPGVQMDASTQSYQVSWNTATQFPPLDRNLLYRIVVVAGGAVAGYADVVPVASGQPTGNIDRTQYVVVPIGSVVPIRFRLEVPVPSIVDIATGDNYTCSVDDINRTFCWGDISFQPGVIIATPTLLGGGVPLATLARGGGGAQHICGFDPNQAAFCWGQNFTGEVGDGTAGNLKYTPVAVIGGLPFTALTVGVNHTCGLTSSGAAYCWGENDHGQLGNGTSTVNATPQPVRVATKLPLIAIQAGGRHTCALTNEGKPFCWGANWSGQVGDGTLTDRLVPTAVKGTFASLGLGFDHSCAITADAKAYCWGDNQYAELGDGTTTNRPTPVAVRTTTAFSQLTAGQGHTCALTSSGAAYCWGNNGFGELGDGTITQRPIPTAVSGGLALTLIRAGAIHTCAISVAGRAYCWGNNDSGQLGDLTTMRRLAPTPVAFP